jgi:hypothetical protein
MQMLTVCCYDPHVVASFCNLGGPVPSHVKPMMTLICDDAAGSAAVFYQLFDLLQFVNVRIEFNTLQIDFPDQSTERLFTILIHLHRHYKVLGEQNTYNNGVLYSTTCWEIPVSVKRDQYSITK